MCNWDLREFRAQVNLQSPIGQVQVLIQRVITPIWGLPNPIRNVVTLISHIRLYPPYHSHLHPNSLFLVHNSTIIAEHKVKSFLSMSPCHDHELTPSTASTQDCLSSLHSHDYKLTPECSFSFQHTSLHDRLPSASSPWELKGKVTLSHSHSCKLTNWWIEFQHPARRPLTASKYWSNLARSWPPNVSPNWLDHSLQVHNQRCSHTISECISKFTLSRPPSLSPHLLNHTLQLYRQTRTITVSQFAQSQPPSASPQLLDHGLHVYIQTRSIIPSKWDSKLAQFQPSSSYHCGLQVHLQTHPIMASKFAPSRSPSVSPSSRDHGLGVDLWIHSIVIFRCTSDCS